jgi:lipopolysaccharide export system protein LptC
MARDPGLHSRIVGILKVGLPLVALGLLASIFLVQTEDTLGGNLVFSQGDIDALGQGLRITNPTFTGTTAGQDRFRFTAALVEPDAAPPTRARITTLAGEVALHNGPVVELEADTGDLHIPTERLDVAGNVRIRTSGGYRMAAEQATLDLKAGSVVAGNAVETTGPLGQIDSGSLAIQPAAASGEARRFSFANGVRLVYDPPDSG